VNYLYSSCDVYTIDNTTNRWLAHECPEKPHTYWIHSDNYLASLVLETYDPHNTMFTGMAENITESMDHELYLNGTNPISPYMVLDMTLNKSDFPSGGTKDSILRTVDGASIMITTYDAPGPLHPINYSDIAFLQAILYSKLGDENHAMAAFNDGVYRWDGNGFKDDPFTNPNSSSYLKYQTYKLALYIYACRILDHVESQGSNYTLALNTLLTMQDPNGNGGFNTSYNWTSDDARVHGTGGMNTETTCLAILALNRQSSGHDSLSWAYFVLPISILIACAAIITWLKLRDSTKK